MSNINAEQLAKADVDVLVIGLFQPNENADAYAQALFKQYPQWNAAKTNTYTSVADEHVSRPLEPDRDRQDRQSGRHRWVIRRRARTGRI